MKLTSAILQPIKSFKPLFNLLRTTHPEKIILPNVQTILTTKSLTPSLTFITTKESKSTQNLQINVPDLSNYSSDGRPLAILLPWVNFKPIAVKRYVEFYTERGFDVLQIRISAIELACASWLFEPIVQNQILPTLLSSNHETKVIHGLSVGGAVFGCMIKHMTKDPSTYDSFLKSIRCQIWDSFTEPENAKDGVVTSIFPKSALGQKLASKVMDFHFRVFPTVMKSLEEASYYFHNKPYPVPALLFYSKEDKIGTFEMNEGVREAFERNGVQCRKIVWNDSPHVFHMKMHPEEYKNTLDQFLIENGVITKIKSN